MLDTLGPIHHQEPTPLAELRPEVPPTVVDLVERLLAKDQVLRPASPRQVAGELAKLGSEEPLLPP